jgi:hypothetical protein
VVVASFYQELRSASVKQLISGHGSREDEYVQQDDDA